MWLSGTVFLAFVKTWVPSSQERKGEREKEGRSEEERKEEREREREREKEKHSQVLWCTSNPSTGRLRQGDGEFNTSLSYIDSVSKKKKKKKFK
jgi:hypothetical protein